MSILLNTNFHILAPAPIDVRMQVATYAGLDAIVIKYDHMICHVIDEELDYIYHAEIPEWVPRNYGAVWGEITGDITNQTDLIDYLVINYAPIDHTHPCPDPVCPHGHWPADIYDIDGIVTWVREHEAINYILVGSDDSTGVFQGTMSNFTITDGTNSALIEDGETIEFSPDFSLNPTTQVVSYIETDPTVPAHVKAITTGDISEWDMAYAHAISNHNYEWWLDNPAGDGYVLVSTVAGVRTWVDASTIGVTDHTLLTNIGTNTHVQIDSHIADSTIHFLLSDAYFNLQTDSVQRTTIGAGDILDIIAGTDITVSYGAGGKVTINSTSSGITDHTLLTNIGTNTHVQIDTHIADGSIHTDTWQANTQAQEGYVSAGGSNYNYMWATDGAGNPAWRPYISAVSGGMVVHDQDIASQTWTFVHGLGFQNPQFSVWDAKTVNGEVVYPTYIRALSDTTAEIYFSTAATGRATAMIGGVPVGVYEPVLGNPSSDGDVLSSTIAGSRTWITPLSSPLTTKGDIWTYDSADQRLAVGATLGMVLSVDATEPTGLKWIVPATGGGGTELLDEGNGDGLVIAGRTAGNYGNVGQFAVDLSYSSGVSSVFGATGYASFAAGEDVEASGQNATAIGYGTVASGDYSVAIGDGAEATNSDAIAFGYSALSSGSESIALGSGSATSSYAITIGDGTLADAVSAVAIGSSADAGGINAVAFGKNSDAGGNDSIAIGGGAITGATVSSAGAAGDGAIAIGSGASVAQSQGIAIGKSAASGGTGSGGIAIGVSSTASGYRSVALGAFAVSSGSKSIAIGTDGDTNAYSYFEISMGQWGTAYTPGSTFAWDNDDRLFNIGIGTAVGTRHDAFTILKGGEIGIGYDNFEASHSGLVQVEIAGAIQSHKAVSDDVSTTRNLALADRDTIVTMSNAGAISCVIPANASVAFPIGTEIVLANKGTGVVTVSITTDTLNTELGGLTIPQYGMRTIRKITATSWLLGY